MLTAHSLDPWRAPNAYTRHHGLMTNPDLLGADSSVSASFSGLMNHPDVLGGFKRERFVQHKVWARLKATLENGSGGSYGVSGPRGAGKTWMMWEAISWARERDGIGVLFPSPSEYEPQAFLTSISDVVAREFENWHDNVTRRTTRAVRNRATVGFTVGIVVAYLGIFALWGSFRPGGGGFGFIVQFLPQAIALLVIFAGLVGAGLSWRYYIASRKGLGKARALAEDLRRQARYATSIKDLREAGAEAGRWGLKTNLKQATERTLVERPASLSSWVTGFRDFATMIGTTLGAWGKVSDPLPESLRRRGERPPVVICVDELDKMTDPDRVAGLLRDVKGIFDLPGVYFLVSISDEAARGLELASTRSRDEFNSSFYTVFRIPGMTVSESSEMLEKRGVVSDELRCLLSVMSGGLPREIVRNAEVVFDPPEAQPSASEALHTIVTLESQAFIAELLASRGPSADDSLEHVKWSVSRILDGADSAGALHFDSLVHWSIGETSQTWIAEFQEEWRRLLVRRSVASLIVKDPGRLSGGKSAALQRVIRVTTDSSTLGRFRLVEHLLTEEYGSQLTELTHSQIELLCQALFGTPHSVDLRPFADMHSAPIITVLRDAIHLTRVGLFRHAGYAAKTTVRLRGEILAEPIPNL